MNAALEVYSEEASLSRYGYALSCAEEFVKSQMQSQKQQHKSDILSVMLLRNSEAEVIVEAQTLSTTAISQCCSVEPQGNCSLFAAVVELQTLITSYYESIAKQAVVILLTDGITSDDDFENARSVMQYWPNSQFQSSMKVCIVQRIST